MDEARVEHARICARWSVAARTTWWFALTTAVLLLAICVLAMLFLGSSIDRQEVQHESWLAPLSWSSLAPILLAVGAMFVIGVVYIQRMGGSLRETSAKVLTVQANSNAPVPEIPTAPDEIREMVDAVRAALGRARSEAERTYLMTTGITHQLGSPIQNLIGSTEVALMSERTSHEYREVLNSQLDELRDIVRTLGNLTALCALSTSTPPAEVEQFDLGQESTLRLRREQAHANRRGVVLAVTHRGDLSIVGDREALLLAVVNVVANAIDWSPRGATIRVDLRGLDDWLEITVDDAGPGIAEAERAKIFEPFNQGPAAQGKRASYGLGLSQTKKAVDTHGGALEIADSSLGGARFTLRLPRQRRDDVRAA